VGTYAVTPDGASLAYLVSIGGRSKLVLVGAHARVWPVAVSARTVAGILPGGDVVYNDRSRASIEIAHQDGTITRLDYRYALAVSSVTGVIAAATGGVTSGGDECWRLVSSTGAALSRQICGPDQPMFNADGTQIATTSHPPTGVLGASGDTGMEIFDASNLQPVAGFQAPAGGNFSGDLTWDGDAVLTSIWSRGRWTLVWLSPHGVTKQQATQRPGRADHSPWTFGTGPLQPVH